jgi:hypothetical protein
MPFTGSLISTTDVSFSLLVVVVVVSNADLSSLPVVVFDDEPVCARRALLWPLERSGLDICRVLKGLEGTKADLLRLAVVAVRVGFKLEDEKAEASLSTAKQER